MGILVYFLIEGTHIEMKEKLEDPDTKNII